MTVVDLFVFIAMYVVGTIAARTLVPPLIAWWKSGRGRSTPVIFDTVPVSADEARCAVLEMVQARGMPLETAAGEIREMLARPDDHVSLTVYGGIARQVLTRRFHAANN